MASSEVKDVWRKWINSKDKKRKSRVLLPFLIRGNADRDYLVANLLAHTDDLVELDFSVKEFDLIPMDEKTMINTVDAAFERKNMPLLFALIKAYGHHGACCTFEVGTKPREILEAMQSQLGENGIVSCYIPEVDYKEMIHYGLIPCPILNVVESDEFRNVLRYYREGFSNEEIAYWTGVLNAYDYLCKVCLWSFTTLDYIESKAREGDSYPAIFNYPEMLYASNRPRTEMKLFRTAVSHTYDREDELPERRIAVTRYAKGMSKGQFYDSRPANICGYFFYFEPESTTFLAYRRSLVAFNKTDAARILLKEKYNQQLAVVYRKLQFTPYKVRHDILMDHISGKLPADLRFNPNTARKLLQYEGKTSYKYVENSTRKVYLDSQLYAFEDKFDQPLCNAAADAGYDIVILTAMVGSYQVVTEVLDTRSDSMKHLWFQR